MTLRARDHGGHADRPHQRPQRAYELKPADWREGWWTATCNGIPVYHFSPAARHAGERYVADSDYRLSLIRRYIHG